MPSHRTAAPRQLATIGALLMDRATLALVHMDVALAMVMQRVTVSAMVMDTVRALVLNLVLVAIMVMAAVTLMSPAALC